MVQNIYRGKWGGNFSFHFFSIHFVFLNYENHLQNLIHSKTATNKATFIMFFFQKYFFNTFFFKYYRPFLNLFLLGHQITIQYT